MVLAGTTWQQLIQQYKNTNNTVLYYIFTFSGMKWNSQHAMHTEGIAKGALLADPGRPATPRYASPIVGPREKMRKPWKCQTPTSMQYIVELQGNVHNLPRNQSNVITKHKTSITPPPMRGALSSPKYVQGPWGGWCSGKKPSANKNWHFAPRRQNGVMLKNIWMKEKYQDEGEKIMPRQIQ